VKFLQKETKGTKVLADGQTFLSGITLLSSFASVEFQSAFIRVHLRLKAFLFRVLRVSALNHGVCPDLGLGSLSSKVPATKLFEVSGRHK